MMQNNVIYAVDYGVYSSATSNCQITNCTIDTFNQIGISLLAIGNDGSYNWRILNNILGTKSATANSGILISGSNASAQDDGAIIIGNYIRAYNGGSLTNGIDTHLSGTTGFGTDIIMGNTITGCTSHDIYGNTTGIITSNQALDNISAAIQSGGLIANNIGNVYYQRAVNYATVGPIHITYDENVPTAGTWSRGDICYNINASAGGTPGWVCVTAGTPGTWKAMAALAA